MRSKITQLETNIAFLERSLIEAGKKLSIIDYRATKCNDPNESLILQAEENEMKNHVEELQRELKDAKEALEEYSITGRTQLRD